MSKALQGMMRAPKQRPTRAPPTYEVAADASSQDDPAEADEGADTDDDNVNAALEGDARGRKEKPAKRRSPTKDKLASLQQGEDGP